MNNNSFKRGYVCIQGSIENNYGNLEQDPSSSSMHHSTLNVVLIVVPDGFAGTLFRIVNWGTAGGGVIVSNEKRAQNFLTVKDLTNVQTWQKTITLTKTVNYN